MAVNCIFLFLKPFISFTQERPCKWGYLNALLL